MSNFKRKTTNGYESIPINADKLGGMTLEQIQALINGLVTLATKQTITGEKTFNAPANSNGTEQATVIIKTANGGQIIFGKEGPNSGSMIGLDQVAGTRRLNFRASSTPGAIVWSQPESNSSLYYDVTNIYFRECTSVVFNNFANASALGTDSSGKLKKVSLATVATSGSYSDLKNKPTIPSKLSQMTNDANYVKSTDNIDADTLAGKTYQEILNLINKKQDSSNFLSLIQNLSTLYTGYLHVTMKNVGTDMKPSWTPVANLESLPVATSKLDGIVKLGSDTEQSVAANAVSSTASRTYAIQKDSSGKMVVNVPWTDTVSSGSSYTLPTATSNRTGGVKAIFGSTSGGEGNFELFVDIRQGFTTNDEGYDSGGNTLYIRAGQFKQTSGSASSTTRFTFKRAMNTMGGSATSVAVILGDSYGQSTSGGYMGSLAVDGSDYDGFKYRASNGEKGHVYYIAIGRW